MLQWHVGGNLTVPYFLNAAAAAASFFFFFIAKISKSNIIY